MTGFGGMLSFDIRGGKAAAFRFIQALQIFAFAESLAGSNPWSSTPKP